MEPAALTVTANPRPRRWRMTTHRPRRPSPTRSSRAASASPAPASPRAGWRCHGGQPIRPSSHASPTSEAVTHTSWTKVLRRTYCPSVYSDSRSDEAEGARVGDLHGSRETRGPVLDEGPIAQKIVRVAQSELHTTRPRQPVEARPEQIARATGGICLRRPVRCISRYLRARGPL